MKLAISNIAWRADEERAIADLLQARRVRGVEVAPGMVSSSPATATDDEIARYRAFWNERDIEIVAMQALLFGTQGLALFESESARRDLSLYLARIVRLGGLLGARALVFGSPKNRVAGKLAPEAVTGIAVPFFRALGALAVDHGTCVCIEPNPPVYGADWIVNAREALEFVALVDHPGVGMHLDAGALHIQNEGPAEIRAAGVGLRHFHASQPDLVPLCAGGLVPHATYAAALRSIGYERWISVEMRAGAGAASNRPAVETALAHALSVYGS
ncbi:MAG: sugar phosphate isomerase/epimerase [Planctomycetes bacterium]|nr:sugar phosphate isomerase/epimerase [Planctomycetota bacterium]